MLRFTGTARRRRRPAAIVVSVLSVGVLAACTHPDHRPPRRSTTTTVAPTGARPVAIVEGGSKTLRLNGFGCWTDGLCVDPAPPGIFDDWPDIGDAGPVTVTIALEGASFGARFVPLPAAPDAADVPGTMTRTGPTSWRLAPPKSPGSYAVYISGGSAQGDLTYIFRWTVS
jgi:hypothetical protein